MRLAGAEVDVPLPPGIGAHSWSSTSVNVKGTEWNTAVLLHTDRRCLTAALEIEPSGLGRLDYADQAALLDLFGRDVLSALGNGPGYGKRLQMIARQLKSDPQAHARDIADRGDPHAAEWLRESYDELHAQLLTSAEEHRFWAVLSLDYTPDLVLEAEAFGGGTGGLCHVVGRELEALAVSLAAARLPVVRPLGTAGLAAVPRNAYDHLGALNVYAHGRGVFDGHAVAMGEAFSPQAAVSVHNAQLLDRAERLVAQLQQALTSRAEIDEALGVIMSRTGATAQEASDKLRALSQTRSVKLTEVAHEVFGDAVRRAAPGTRRHPRTSSEDGHPSQ